MITGFDVEQLVTNVRIHKARRGLSIAMVARQAGLSKSTLSHFLRLGSPEAPRLMTVVKLMCWLGDYDIRDYLLEER